jgi:DNA-3-methyladenine glycosylase I
MTDERRRCSWADSAPEYQAYHDEEWGRNLHGRDPLYERMTLEAFQSGLSWITILRKRPAFRAAFADFDVERVATFGEQDELRLMADAGIVRNRAKIAAAVANARTILDDVPEGLDALLWSFAPPPQERRAGIVRPSSPESIAMAKSLKSRGFRFLGPTTCYALMQAVGMVNDHAADCWLAPNPDAAIG